MGIFKKQKTSIFSARRFADSPLSADESNRFLMPDGSVRWVATDAYPTCGHLWMAGRKARYCLYYCADEDGALVLIKHCEYSFLTSGGYAVDYDCMSALMVDGASIDERVTFIDAKGSLRIVSEAHEFQVERTYYPAVQSLGLIERVAVTNLSAEPRTVRIQLPDSPMPHKGVKETITSGVTLADERGRMLTDLVEEDSRLIQPEEEGVFYLVYWSKHDVDLMVDCRLEWKKRSEQIADGFADTLSITTPEPIFDRAFAHALTYATEHLMDAPVGVLPMAEDLRVEEALKVLPTLALSGVHRAALAAKDLVALLATESTVPAHYDRDMRATGTASPVLYALSLAHYALVAGQSVAGELFSTVETAVERICRVIRDGLYTPKRRAVCATQCAVYALLETDSRLAFALDMPVRGAAWQGQATQMRRRIDEVYTSPLASMARWSQVDRDMARTALYYGIDEASDPLGRVLIADWLARVEEAPTLRDDTVAPLDTVYALARSGYADAAAEMARRYTHDTLLGAHAPYPVAAHLPVGDQSPYVAWRYCQTLLWGWLGLEILSFERIALTLHLPNRWRHFAVRGIHIGELVLNVVWRDNRLDIQDIFGTTYYDGTAVCGQHIEVALSH